MFRRPPSLCRVVLGCGLSRLHRYYSNAKTSRHPSRRASFSFAWRYHGRVGDSLPCEGRRALAGPGCWLQAATHGERACPPPIPPIIRGEDRISQVPAEPSVAMHTLLRPRKNPTELAVSSRLARPQVRQRPRLLQLHFRGSIAWLGDWLSTLRRFGCPTRRKTRLRLLARLCRAGFGPAEF